MKSQISEIYLQFENVKVLKLFFTSFGRSNSMLMLLLQPVMASKEVWKKCKSLGIWICECRIISLFMWMKLLRFQRLSLKLLNECCQVIIYTQAYNFAWMYIHWRLVDRRDRLNSKLCFQHLLTSVSFVFERHRRWLDRVSRCKTMWITFCKISYNRHESVKVISSTSWPPMDQLLQTFEISNSYFHWIF